MTSFNSSDAAQSRVDKVQLEIQSEKLKILFLALEPIDTNRLRLNKELKDISNRLNKDKFQLEHCGSVRPKDVYQIMLDFKPHIVHFAGHGMETGELCFEDEQGNTQSVPPKALATLFQLFAEDIRCVIINTCYSEDQAKAIAEYVPFVIGMKQAIVDTSAIEFATGFYTALAAGQTIEQAFKIGCLAIQLEGLVNNQSTPTLVFGDPQKRFYDEVEQIVSQLPEMNAISEKIYKKAFQEKGKRMGFLEKEIESIIKEVLKPIQEYKQKIKKYEQVFGDTIRQDFPLSEETRKALQFLQNALGLKDRDIDLIENKIISDSNWQTPESFFDRGLSYRISKDYKKAINNFSQAIDLRPTYSGAYLERGVTYYELNDDKMAIENYTQAIEINSNWDLSSLSTAHFERGLAYFRYAKKENNSENMKAAIREWIETLRLKPNYSIAYYNIALSYSALDEHDKAIENYTKAIDINTDWGAITPADAYYNLGSLYQKLGDGQAAKQEFQKAFEILQTNSEYINLFSEIRLEYLKTLFNDQCKSTVE